MKSPLSQTIWRLSLVTLMLGTALYSACLRANNNPVISRLEVEKGQVTTSGSRKVYCVASDADGDNLTYTWSATGGTFSGTGAVVTWMAPDIPGAHTITVTVSDGRGGEAATELNVDVIVNHPPSISSLTATPSEVIQGKTTTIECFASDTDGDELTYLWSADRGNITGEGSSIVWIAPLTCGSYAVTVTVADGRGGEARRELIIRVKKPG